MKNPAVDTNSTEFQNAVITGNELDKVKKYKGIEVSDVKIEVDKDRTRVRAILHNATDKAIEEQWMNINILDKEGQRITSLAGYIDNLQPGESAPLNSSIAAKVEDLEATNIEITEKREPLPTEDVVITEDGEVQTGRTNDQNGNNQ